MNGSIELCSYQNVKVVQVPNINLSVPFSPAKSIRHHEKKLSQVSKYDSLLASIRGPVQDKNNHVLSSTHVLLSPAFSLCVLNMEGAVIFISMRLFPCKRVSCLCV